MPRATMKILCHDEDPMYTRTKKSIVAQWKSYAAAKRTREALKPLWQDGFPTTMALRTNIDHKSWIGWGWQTTNEYKAGLKVPMDTQEVKEHFELAGYGDEPHSLQDLGLSGPDA